MFNLFDSEKSSRFHSDSRFRRRIMLIAVAVFLVLVAGLTLASVTVALFSSSGKNFSNRLVETSDILAAATLLLTILAALVALRAYVVSTGLPDLKVRVKFEWSASNQPVFQAEMGEDDWLRARRFKQTIGTISIRNISGYSAKNPAVIVRLEAMAFLPNAYLDRSSGWKINEAINTVGATVIQWDGGVTYSIHGYSVRQLPAIDLDQVCKIPEAGGPALRIEMLAEGYSRSIIIPVAFKVEGQPQPEAEETEELPDWI